MSKMASRPKLILLAYSEALRRVKDFKSYMIREYGRLASAYEISSHFGISKKDLSNITRKIASLNKSIICISLHTEPSHILRPNAISGSIANIYGLSNYCIYQGNRRIPILWSDTKWADNFSKYVIDIIRQVIRNLSNVFIHGGDIENKLKAQCEILVEIHPPYFRIPQKLINSVSCPYPYFDLEKSKAINYFLDIYEDFERKLKDLFQRYVKEENIDIKYKYIHICLENRATWRWIDGEFLISDFNDIQNLINAIQQRNTNLKLVIDLSQLKTAMKDLHGTGWFRQYMHGIQVLFNATNLRYIKALHIYGYTTGRVKRAHGPDVVGFFEGSNNLNNILSTLSALLQGKSLYILPEIFRDAKSCLNIISRYFAIY